MTLEARRLAAGDVPAWRALMLQAYADHPEDFTSSVAEREPLPLSWWAARLGDPLADGDAATSVVFGAFDGGRLVGAAGLQREARERTRHKATLFGMAVAPAARGRGAGRALVEAVLAQARAWPGLRAVQLTVSAGNGVAERLYARCGFVAFGIEPLAVAVAGGYVAKVHMQVDLGPVDLG